MPLRDWSQHLMYFPASNGGRGSFSYADTTIFGDRQLRQDVSILVGYGYGSMQPRPMIAGGGGGARPLSLPFGSRAPGYSPHGVVLIRLTRIEDE